MSDEYKAAVSGAAICLVAALIWTAFIFGCYFGVENTHAEAVQHNAAHYTVNPQTGETKFEWEKESIDEP